jgi:DNA-binding LacI/PurR family transcriptional regulator
MAKNSKMNRSVRKKRLDRSAGDRPDIPSYRDIAAKTGVSAQTVSYVVRNTPGVSDATRKRVLAVMEKLGYKPQPALSALMRQYRLHPAKRDAMKMAFINSWNEPLSKSSAEPLRNFYLGARAQADRLGYQVEEFQGGETSDDQAKLRKQLQFSGAEGVLLFPTLSPFTKLNLDWEKYSVVEIGQPLQGVEVTLVIPDHFGNAFRLCQRLVEEGFSRIGFLHDRSEHERIGGTYLGGVLAASFLDGQKHFVPPLSGHGLTTSQTIKYVQTKKCDALIVGAHFNVQSLRNAGIRVPEDVSLFGTGVYSSDIAAGIFGIDEEWFQVGEIAAQHLARLMQSHERGFTDVREVVTVPGRWIQGKPFARSKARALGTLAKMPNGAPTSEAG